MSETTDTKDVAQEKEVVKIEKKKRPSAVRKKPISDETQEDEESNPEYIKALKEVQKQRTRSKGINAGVTNSASIPEKEKEDPLVDRMFRSLDSQFTVHKDLEDIVMSTYVEEKLREKRQNKDSTEGGEIKKQKQDT